MKLTGLKEMSWQEWAKIVLVDERSRKLQSNALMEEGRVSLSEARDGVRVDITQDAIETNKEHIAEIEHILTEAGVPFE